MACSALGLMGRVAGQAATAATADGVFSGHLMLGLAQMTACAVLPENRVGRAVSYAVKAAVALIRPFLFSERIAGDVDHALSAVHQALYDVLGLGGVAVSAGLFGVGQPTGMDHQTVMGLFHRLCFRVAEMAALALARQKGVGVTLVQLMRLVAIHAGCPCRWGKHQHEKAGPEDRLDSR